MTEKLRSWHFQTLLCRGKEIEESCNDSNSNAVNEYVEKRKIWFKSFMLSHDGKLDSKLTDMIESAEATYSLLHDHKTGYNRSSSVASMVFEAYRSLRLMHQADYAAHKLKRTTNQPFWKPRRWPVIVLRERLATIASFCIVSALLVSAFTVFAHFADFPLPDDSTMAGISLCLLVVSVSAKSLLEGLAVREETQRYVDYAGEVKYLLTRFENNRDQAVKYQILEDMERAAIEELKGFLRAHYEAKFVV